ncbi:MAG: hypothetical protein U9Q83_07235, partial [Bacteroidota bacterium]|nr:hypothetical protein [Bacteroidota bacterium]
FLKNIENLKEFESFFLEKMGELFRTKDKINGSEPKTAKEKEKAKKREKIIPHSLNYILKQISPEYNKVIPYNLRIENLFDELEEYTKRKREDLTKKYTKEEFDKIFIIPFKDANLNVLDVIDENIKSWKNKIEKGKVSGREVPISIKQLNGVLETRKYLEQISNFHDYTLTLESMKNGHKFYNYKTKEFDFFGFRGQMVYGWQLELLSAQRLKELDNNIENIELAPEIHEQIDINNMKEFSRLKKENPELELEWESFKNLRSSERRKLGVINLPSIDIVGKNSTNGKKVNIEVKHYYNYGMYLKKSLGIMLNRFDSQIKADKRDNSETYYNLNFYDKDNVVELFIPVKDMKDFYIQIEDTLKNKGKIEFENYKNTGVKSGLMDYDYSQRENFDFGGNEFKVNFKHKYSSAILDTNGNVSSNKGEISINFGNIESIKGIFSDHIINKDVTLKNSNEVSTSVEGNKNETITNKEVNARLIEGIKNRNGLVTKTISKNKNTNNASKSGLKIIKKDNQPTFPTRDF